MIIGRGLIANQFLESDREDVIFFASGVSNSLEKDPIQFKREKDLIESTINLYPKRLFIYFSTCSIYDSSKYNSPYVLHKLHMEEVVKEYAKNYLILRVSNAVGSGGNPNLLMNYFYNQINNKKTLNIHRYATRNLIDVEDVRNITLNYIALNKWNRIINVAYKESYFISEIILAFEIILAKSIEIEIEELGEHYSIDTYELIYNFPSLNKNDYLLSLINKYYKK